MNEPNHSVLHPVTALRSVIALSLTALLAACSPVAYKPVLNDGVEQQNGYLDKEIAPGVYVIEVRQIGGYQFILNYDDTITTFKQHGRRRATELCSAGYVGVPEVLLPAEARLEEFHCNLRYCQDYPIVSGVAYCHQRYSL